MDVIPLRINVLIVFHVIKRSLGSSIFCVWNGRKFLLLDHQNLLLIVAEIGEGLRVLSGGNKNSIVTARESLEDWNKGLRPWC